jgi:hypothetical protein
MAGGDIAGVLGVDRNDEWSSHPAVEVSIRTGGWCAQVENHEVVGSKRDFTFYETVFLIQLLESVLRANNKPIYHPQTNEPVWIPQEETIHGKER